MKNRIVVSKDYTIGSIERELWGSFVEHMGRSVYGGIYDPEHPLADEHGFRKDVIAAIKELNVPIIRYPGGNFLSGYCWKDGIGKNRPVRLDLAWGQIEPNLVGLHEFFDWSEKVGSDVMMAVNMGTGTPSDAAQIVEYCNYAGGTTTSELRRANGKAEPFAIKTWCIGNEMDGDWQICALTAEEYGRKAAETAKLMKWVDSDIRLTICGSSSPVSPPYPDWDRVVLQHTYNYVDYISLHRYYTYTESGRLEDFMSAHTDFDGFIKTVASTADYVGAYKRSKKKMKLSLDEWNIWHTKPTATDADVYNDTSKDRWTVGPRRVENVYDLADAVAFAGLVCTLVNNADRVKMGCLAQLVNVIAPVMTENGGRMFRQTIYYPYQLAIKYAKGRALRLANQSEKMDSDYGETEKIYAACAYDEGEYALFAINKTGEEQECLLDFATESVVMKERIEMKGDPHAHNSFDEPDKVVPAKAACEKGKKAQFGIKLPPYSFTLLRFAE